MPLVYQKLVYFHVLFVWVQLSSKVLKPCQFRVSLPLPIKGWVDSGKRICLKIGKNLLFGVILTIG